MSLEHVHRPSDISPCPTCRLLAWVLRPRPVDLRWPGLLSDLTQREIAGQRKGDSVDLAEIILRYRELAESPPGL